MRSRFKRLRQRAAGGGASFARAISPWHTVRLRRKTWAPLGWPSVSVITAYLDWKRATPHGEEVEEPGKGKQRAGNPAQGPAQQSVLAVHGAPVGAQASRQASFPVKLGAHTPEQQSAAREHGRSAGRHTLVDEHRESALHTAVASQHSADFLQAAPMALQPGASAQRRTPSGTVRQVPEQQSSSDWQRSSLAKHPPAPWQRRSAPHTPEQQSLGAAHRSAMILQPGSTLQ
jgi:hypothetical protein